MRTAPAGGTPKQGGRAAGTLRHTPQPAEGARTALTRLQAAQQQWRHALGQQGVQPPLRLWVKQGCLRLVQRVQRHQRAVDAGQRHFPGVHGLARAACGSAACCLQELGLGCMLAFCMRHCNDCDTQELRGLWAATDAYRAWACPALGRGPGGGPRQRCRRSSGMRHAEPCRQCSAFRTGRPCCTSAAAGPAHIFRCCLQALLDWDTQRCAPERTTRARSRTGQRPQPPTRICGAAG